MNATILSALTTSGLLLGSLHSPTVAKRDRYEASPLLQGTTVVYHPDRAPGQPLNGTADAYITSLGCWDATITSDHTGPTELSGCQTQGLTDIDYNEWSSIDIEVVSTDDHIVSLRVIDASNHRINLDR